MAELVEAIETHLNRVRVLCGSGAEHVDQKDDRYGVTLENGAVLSADAVILATPAYVSAGLVEGMDTALASLLASIPYASTATISLGFEEKALTRPLDGHGYIIPRREGRPVLACTWTSSKFPHRAPPGRVLLRGFVGRAGREEELERTDEELVHLFREELRTTLGIGAEPVLTRVFRWPRAMPQYRVGHREMLREIDERLQRLPGLYLAGAAYGGVGVPDCIQSGEIAAARVTERITAGRQ
jgi:oxygen-dependent protoporphyrinogen oxidase